MRSFSRLFALGLATLLPLVASAAPMGKGEVQRAIGSYAKARGIRAQGINAKILGESASGKSTLAMVNVGSKEFKVAINHDTGRVQSRETGAMVEGLLSSHVAYKRAGLGKDSMFATKIVSFRPGSGVAKISLRSIVRNKIGPIGRPRAGQSSSMEALDAFSLGRGGSVVVKLGNSLVAGKRGAAVRVRENGLGSGEDIINQTPGFVSVSDGSKWYRLGYAGYKTAGDVLLLDRAMDPIPAGTVIKNVRVTDAPNGPHPAGFDPTDNAVASARGVRGFDLVSVEGMAGAGK